MRSYSIYSSIPINNILSHEALSDTQYEAGYHIYTITETAFGKDKAKSDILDFVFFALMEAIVKNALESKKMQLYIDRLGKKPHKKDVKNQISEISEAFVKKLSEYVYKTGNKAKIDKMVSGLLKNEKTLNLDGIIAFRLREFQEDISAFFDMLFYEFNVKKQYEEFISLVKEYIMYEAPKEAAVHILFKNKTFRLFDSQKKELTAFALKKYMQDSGATEQNANDFLISSLLDYLPRKIFLHVDEDFGYGIDGVINNKIIETVKAIFGGRVVLCDKDSFCQICGQQDDVNKPSLTRTGISDNGLNL